MQKWCFERPSRSRARAKGRNWQSKPHRLPPFFAPKEGTKKRLSKQAEGWKEAARCLFSARSRVNPSLSRGSQTCSSPALGVVYAPLCLDRQRRGLPPLRLFSGSVCYLVSCLPGACWGQEPTLVKMKYTTIEILLLLLAAFSSCSVMQSQDPADKASAICYDKESPFCYDWYSLRVGGLVFAGVTCFLGIIILLSGKCKCKFNKKKSSPVSVAPKGVPAASDSTEC